MLNTKPPEDVFQTSLHDLKNTEGFGPTNDIRDEDAKWIDRSHERQEEMERRWIYANSLGLDPHGVLATSDPLDPRRHRRGFRLATLPPKSEPPFVPKGLLGR